MFLLQPRLHIFVLCSINPTFMGNGDAEEYVHDGVNIEPGLPPPHMSIYLRSTNDSDLFVSMTTVTTSFAKEMFKLPKKYTTWIFG